MLDAWLRRQRVPSPRAIFDDFLQHREVDRTRAWAGDLQLDRFASRDRFDLTLGVARASLEGVYTDTHCWTFTPASFAGLLQFACHFGLARFACERLYPTEDAQIEFIVHLRRTNDTVRAAQSWRNAGEAVPVWEDRSTRELRETVERLGREAGRRRGRRSRCFVARRLGGSRRRCGQRCGASAAERGPLASRWVGPTMAAGGPR